jgi:nucleolar protein 12
MEEGKLKFAKRKLRLQRCKTLPGSAPVPKQTAPLPKDKPTPQDKARARAVVPPMPQGDPALGARLAHLGKDARKAVKAADAARVARRLAKKKARAAFGVPVAAGDGAAKKERARERKTPLERRAAGAHKPDKKKGRVRSEKSVAKRNAKK